MFLKNDKKLEKISNFRKVVQRKKGLLELSLRELKKKKSTLIKGFTVHSKLRQ